MIKLSEEAKKAYAKYVDANGRLIIDDSLPEELKETFEFFNEKGINILEMNIDDSTAESLDNIEVLDMDSDDNSFVDDSTELADDKSIVENDSNVDLDSLNNLFN